jgi:hypothetical protein
MAAGGEHHPQRKNLGWWLASLAGPVLLLLICIGFYWKLVLTDQYTYLESPDLANQVLPWLQMQAAELHRWKIPLWDPYLFGGQSLIGQVITGTAYPLNWILLALPLHDGRIQQSYLHWYFVLAHFMAAWFCYMLCRDLKRSRSAAVVAGCAFALGGWVGTIGWPQMLNSAVWAPLVLLFLLRSLRGEHPVASAAASGAFFGMAWLGGHHQIPIFLLLATGGIWLYHVFWKLRPDWHVARLAAIFLIFTVLVGGLQILPAYEYGRLAKRWVGAAEIKGWNEPVPYTVHSEYSLIPTSLVGIFVPGYSRHSDPFIGVGALTLALLAVALAWKERNVRLFAMMGTGGLLFSLGRNDVFHGMLYALAPLVEKARSPNNAVFIYHFGIAILIAHGIDYFLDRESHWPQRASVVLTVFGLFLFGLVSVLAVVRQPPGDDRFVVVALAALLFAAVLYGWRKGNISPRTAAALALGLMLIEFGNTAGIYWPNKEETDRTFYLKKLTENIDIAMVLRSQPTLVRVDLPEKDISYNFGDWYGIEQYGGYVASLPVNLLRLAPHRPQAKQLFGVNFSVGREPPGPNQEEVFKSGNGLRIYRNTDAFPRVWAVHRARKLRKEKDIEPTLIDPSIDLRRETFLLVDPPRMESCEEGDDVRLIRHSPGHVTFEADMGCRGMAILGDSYFPGWVATVDGKSAPIFEAYTAVRGVMVDKGKHRIEMLYRPLSVFAGFGMTLVGIFGAVVLNVRAHRRES